MDFNWNTDLVRLKADRRTVKKLLDIEEGLSDWEVNFIESLADKVLDDNLLLSKKEKNIVTDILDRCEY